MFKELEENAAGSVLAAQQSRRRESGAFSAERDDTGQDFLKELTSKLTFCVNFLNAVYITSALT